LCFLRRKLSIISASMPEQQKLRIASRGLTTRGSPKRLKDVLTRMGAGACFAEPFQEAPEQRIALPRDHMELGPGCLAGKSRAVSRPRWAGGGCASGCGWAGVKPTARPNAKQFLLTASAGGTRMLVSSHSFRRPTRLRVAPLFASPAAGWFQISPVFAQVSRTSFAMHKDIRA